MHSLDELVSHAARDLDERHGIDAGLDTVVDAIGSAAEPAEAARSTHRLLRGRIRAMRAATEELEQLRARIRYLAAVIPFLEEGWPQLGHQLERRLAEAPQEGLAEWLGDWFLAASSRRIAALERLQGVREMPSGTSLLLDRCAATAAGLAEPSWHRSHVLLEAGAAGIRVGNETVPSAEVRYELRLMLARLALHDHLWEKARSAIAAAEAYKRSPATRALRVRLQRLAGGPPSDEPLDIELGAGEAPADLDVALELIARAGAEGQADLALEMARAAIDALPVLHDIEAEIARLVEESPPELWVAVAERAQRDGEEELFDAAVHRAEWAAPPTAYPILATVAELRSVAADEAERPPDERAALRVHAGMYRLFAGQVEAAQELFSLALALEPDDVEASLLLADSLIVRSAGLPLSIGAEDLKSGIARVVAAHRAGQITSELSWSFLTESAGRQALSEDVSVNRDDQLWRAALAAARALAHSPDLGVRWADLANVVAMLELGSVALEFATHAVSLEPDDESILSSEIGALTNLGRYDDALARMGDRSSGWFGALRGYILSIRGEDSSAVRALRAPDVDTNAAWAVRALVRSLLLADREREAVEEAERALARWRPRIREHQGNSTIAFMLLVLARPYDALEVVESLPPSDSGAAALEMRGAALMLQGEADAGVSCLKRAVSMTRAPVDVQEVCALLRVIRALAVDGRVSRGLDELEGLLRRREAQLQTQPDALTEIASAAAASAAERVVVDKATAFATAAVHIARGDAAAAVATLDAIGEAFADDAELRALQAWAADRADEAPAEPAGPAEPDTSQIQDPAPAADVIERPIRVVMPSTWFAGIADPEDHPFFTEYLPGMRAAAEYAVPGVSVSVSDTLEPDGFQIFVDDVLVDHGSVDPGFRYLRQDALLLLDEDLASQVAPVHETPLWCRLPQDLSPEPGSLATALSMTAAETIAWSIPSVLTRSTSPDPQQATPAATTASPPQEETAAN